MKILALIIVLAVAACAPQAPPNATGPWSQANPGMWVPTQAELDALPR